MIHIQRLGLLLTMGLTYLASCKSDNDFNAPVSNDKSKPGIVTNVKVKNFNGGAYITYDLPKSDNILYVKADYIINEKSGTKRESTSSYFSDTLTVEGFAQKKDYMVSLRTVSRANIESDLVEVKVSPDTPAYQIVAKTLTLTPTFSGVTIDAENPEMKNVVVVLLYNDPSVGKYIIHNQTNSNVKNIDFTSRGFDDQAKQLGVYISDQWGNISDTLFKTVTPLFEKELDKANFSPYNLASNSPITTGSQLTYSIEGLWDGVLNNTLGNAWFTSKTPPYILPPAANFGLGVSAKLSRFVLWQIQGSWWAAGSPKTITLWGSNAAQPKDFNTPTSAAEGAVIGDWVNIGTFKYPLPPSGNPTTSITKGDQDFSNMGYEFLISANAPKVRFVRLVIPENWGGDNTYAQVAELSLFGDPR